MFQKGIKKAHRDALNYFTNKLVLVERVLPTETKTSPKFVLKRRGLCTTQRYALFWKMQIF